MTVISLLKFPAMENISQRMWFENFQSIRKYHFE